ncbi:uncharacterized protein BX664DRAFT_259281 [Halteromyces radiatus]|uniref:uncharacterized protein n=1 Tax=Halteromyces radiatus TaxID=101107 RepID=UPI00221FD28F|nr:uncharacterized protein BX664DRAFT_259281 [Halteromyces radiatus]KAI8097514.1 hypothetical protein BX664DRAFT_259281 [Halteromyces radiatus]
MPRVSVPTISESYTRAIEQAWDRTLAVAQNHVQAFDEQGRHHPPVHHDQSSLHQQQDTQSNRTSSEFYDRERHMMQALDILFGPGYLAFIHTMTLVLDPDSPVAMAFLSHIIERSTLPSKHTMEIISPVILATMKQTNQKSSTLYSSSSSSIPSNLSFFKRLMTSVGLKSKFNSYHSPESTRLKLNATVIWSLLAEKYAGDMCMHMWNNQVGQLLIQMLVDPREDLMVRLFSLLALEKFSLTGKEQSSTLTSPMDISSCSSADQKQKQSFQTHLNSFDTGFIPPKGPIREEWAKYLQLSFCARWALENHIDSSPWNLSHIRTIMNPFDATSHWKFGINGLELRNDRPHFESIRATASVKTGKWYYETLLLSSGIMQLGWATSRCRFTPEEGYGVGDDCNGFAFDTYRTAVWADGTAVYPQVKLKIRCQSGDVLGSFLDLDNGLCSYFINGKDLGLTIEFENPTKQAAKANALKEAQLKAATATTISEPSSSSSTTRVLESSSSSTTTTSGSAIASAASTSAEPVSKVDSEQLYTEEAENTATSLSSSSAATNEVSIPVMGDNRIFNDINEDKVTTITEETPYNMEQTSGKPSSSGTAAAATSPLQTGSAKGLGLYPAISLTTHQHVLLNLGDRPWIYPPPVTCRYHGISEAGRLDRDYRRRVIRWVNQRGYRIRKLHLADNHSPIRPHFKSSSNGGGGSGDGNGGNSYGGGIGGASSNSGTDDYSSSSPLSLTSSTTSNDSLVEYDWDGPLCTICFSEPKNVILLPCQHGGIGQNCAKLLDMW